MLVGGLLKAATFRPPRITTSPLLALVPSPPQKKEQLLSITPNLCWASCVFLCIEWEGVCLVLPDKDTTERAASGPFNSIITPTTSNNSKSRKNVAGGTHTNNNGQGWGKKCLKFCRNKPLAFWTWGKTSKGHGPVTIAVAVWNYKRSPRDTLLSLSNRINKCNLIVVWVRGNNDYDYYYIMTFMNLAFNECTQSSSLWWNMHRTIYYYHHFLQLNYLNNSLSWLFVAPSASFILICKQPWDGKNCGEKHKKRDWCERRWILRTSKKPSYCTYTEVGVSM